MVGVAPEDMTLVREMWTLANNEPLALAHLQRYGVIDRERYRRVRAGIALEFTLETDQRTSIWSYELAILDESGDDIDADVVEYWLTAFFGEQRPLASKRSFLMRDARFTYPCNS